MRIKKREIFANTTLTLIAIIQSLAFGLLVSQVKGHFHCVDTLMGLQYFACFLVIVTIWYEYFWAIWLFEWVPKILDAFIPFVLGALEAQMICSVDPDSTFGIPFEIWAGFLSIAGYCAYVNTEAHYTERDFEPKMEPIAREAKAMHHFAICITLALGSLAIVAGFFQYRFNLMDHDLFSVVLSITVMVIPIALLRNSNAKIASIEQMLKPHDQQ